MPRKPAFQLACTAALLLLATPATAAPVMLEDFESGMSSTVGDAFLDWGSIGMGPLEGATQAVLTTSLGGGAVPEGDVLDGYENGNWPADVPGNVITRVWRRFLRNPGLSSNGDGPMEGSALQITFSADAGDTLMFDYDFLTNDAGRDPYVHTDFAWYHLDDPVADTIGLLTHANEGGLTGFAGPDYADHTGTQTFSLSLGATGTYTLTLGVNDVQDSLGDSALVVDWFRLIKGPEPGTFGLVAAGLTGLHVHARRRRRR